MRFTGGPMNNSWVVLYDVTRNGIGKFPWLIFLVAWIGGDILAGWVIRNPEKRRTTPMLFWFWLIAWNLGWGFGIGGIFSQYLLNRKALESGKYEITEGLVTEFHRQNPWKKGDLELLVVGGNVFRYSKAMLGGGAMRSSAGFDPPLGIGLHVKIYHRKGAIIQMEALRQNT
jgi:hypothetical protein